MKKEYFEEEKNKEQPTENITEEVFEDESKSESSDDVTEDTADVFSLENAKLKEDLLRAMAEIENVKKRCVAEIEKNNKYAISSFGKDLLGVADNLQRALSAAEGTAENEGILQGVRLTADELAHVFEKHGIVPMNSVGELFDPNFHRVVQEIEDKSKPSGEIVAELQKGYMINGRLLREAMVVVAKGGK